MLKAPQIQQGFTVIEMLVASAILIILTAVVLPGFQGVMANLQVRNSGEALLNGLQVARGEAISRNRTIEFILGANTSWTVNDPVNNDIIDSRSSAEGSTDVTRVTNPANATTVTFNALGSAVVNADASPQLTQIDLSSIDATTSLRVFIEVGGRVRLCNPNAAVGNVTAC